jgi:hypothetical protein
MIVDGRLHPFKVGRVWRFSQHEVVVLTESKSN